MAEEAPIGDGGERIGWIFAYTIAPRVSNQDALRISHISKSYRKGMVEGRHQMDPKAEVFHLIFPAVSPMAERGSDKGREKGRSKRNRKKEMKKARGVTERDFISAVNRDDFAYAIPAMEILSPEKRLPLYFDIGAESPTVIRYVKRGYGWSGLANDSILRCVGPTRDDWTPTFRIAALASAFLSARPRLAIRLLSREMRGKIRRCETERSEVYHRRCQWMEVVYNAFCNQPNHPNLSAIDWSAEFEPSFGSSVEPGLTWEAVWDECLRKLLPVIEKITSPYEDWHFISQVIRLGCPSATRRVLAKRDDRLDPKIISLLIQRKEWPLLHWFFYSCVVHTILKTSKSLPPMKWLDEDKDRLRQFDGDVSRVYMITLLLHHSGSIQLLRRWCSLLPTIETSGEVREVREVGGVGEVIPEKMVDFAKRALVYCCSRSHRPLPRPPPPRSDSESREPYFRLSAGRSELECYRPNPAYRSWCVLPHLPKFIRPNEMPEGIPHIRWLATEEMVEWFQRHQSEYRVWNDQFRPAIRDHIWYLAFDRALTSIPLSAPSTETGKR